MSTTTNTAEILLHYLKHMNRSFPGVYSKLDSYRDSEKHMWPDYCYIPRSEIIKFLKENWNDVFARNKNIKPDEYGFSPINCVYRTLSTIYNWRSHKKIYRFDPDLAKLLCTQADESDPYKMLLPLVTLINLPYNGMYIEADIGIDSRTGQTYHGAYVYVDYVNERPVLIITKSHKMLIDGNRITCPFHDDLELYDGISIGECMDITEEHNISGRRNHLIFKNNKDGDQFNHDRKIQWRVINLLMYIMAANADIEQSTETKDTYRPRGDDKPFRDSYREIDQLNVGYRIGNAIRKSRETTRERSIEEFKRIPHVRRGHWHRYWVGERNSRDRVQIIKWIPPVFVNGYNENFNVVSITPVE